MVDEDQISLGSEQPAGQTNPTTLSLSALQDMMKGGGAIWNLSHDADLASILGEMSRKFQVRGGELGRGGTRVPNLLCALMFPFSEFFAQFLV